MENLGGVPEAFYSFTFCNFFFFNLLIHKCIIYLTVITAEFVCCRCFFVFFFSLCSRHVAACLVRTTASVFLFTKRTATFAPARKYSQESTAKTVRTRLKRLLGALARKKIDAGESVS